jgi:hypothetical protein
MIEAMVKNTGYFTSDTEADGIENATHNTFGKQTRILTWKKSRFAFQMYCGLHFQFREVIISDHSYNTRYMGKEEKSMKPLSDVHFLLY